MKIALILARLNSMGGVQRQALSLAHELIALGHKVKVYTLTFFPEKCNPDLLKGLDIFALPEKFQMDTKGSLGFLAEDRMAKQLAFFIDKDTDLLNPHDTPCHHTAYYFKKYVKNIPSAWNVNELPFMRWPPEWEMEIDPNFHDVPQKSMRLSWLFYMAKSRYDNFFVRKQDAVIVFDSAHQETVRRYLGRESFIAHSGVDLGRFRYIPRRAPQREALLLSSGIFLPYRRYEDILQAMKMLFDWGYRVHLSIASDYTTGKRYFDVLQSLTNRLGLSENVKFLGRISDEELDELFRTQHIFVFPHLQSQAISAYEAMAVGLPTIVARLPGAYEILEDKKHALLIPPKDPLALAQAIKNLLDSSDLYQKISAQGAECVRSHLSWKNYAREVLTIFHHIVNR